MKKSIKLKIGGMTCQNCADKVKNSLDNTEGIIDAKVNLIRAYVKLTYNEAFDLEKVKQIIKDIGYEVLEDDIKENEFSNGQLIGIGIIIFAVYLIISNTIGFNIVPKIENTMKLGLLFVIGVLTSLHCIAMCGGINISQCMSGTDDNNSNIKPSIYYNLGRVISYTVIGGIVGGIGSVFNFSNTSKTIITVIAGILMILIGLNMLNIFGFIRKIRFLSKFKIDLKGKSPICVGLLNGLMPCGPLQSMQVYALGTGSIYMGALSMFVFSLGTVPLMLGLGTLVSYLGSKSAKKVLKISSVLILFLGLVMINRGLVISGKSILPVVGKASVQYAVVKDGKQFITTTVTANDYSPEVLVVQKDIPVVWTLNVKELNNCNSPITIAERGIREDLNLGSNTITFTPYTAGRMVYACHMGMITGYIVVVADIKNVDKSAIPNTNKSGSSCEGGSCTSDSSCSTSINK